MNQKHDLEAIQLNLLRLAKAIDQGEKSDELLALVAETLELTHRMKV